MNRSTLLAITAAVALTLACFVVALRMSAGTELIGSASVEIESGIGSEDDPLARITWERARLRDPATGAVPSGMRMRELAFAARLRSSTSADANGAAVDDRSWIWRGPAGVGGPTRALALDAADERVMLAGASSGGVWRSTDAGASWTPTTLRQAAGVTCLAQDTRRGRTSTWYCGTAEPLTGPGGESSETEMLEEARSGGIFTSTDGGCTWSPLPSTVVESSRSHPFDLTYAVAVDVSDTTRAVLYAAVRGGILRSTDGGAGWTRVLTDPDSSRGVGDVVVTRDGVVYATVCNGTDRRRVWRSTDGVTWTDISPPQWPADGIRYAIAVAPSNQNVLYFLGATPRSGLHVSTGSGDEWNSLWKYTCRGGEGAGRGGTWEDRSANLPATGTLGGFRTQLGYDLVATVKPDDENVLFIGGTNLYRSLDAFATTSKIAWIGGYDRRPEEGGLHPDLHALLFSPRDPQRAYAGTDGGIQVARDMMATSPEWRRLDDGYGTAQFYTVSIDHATSGSPMIVGGMQDNGTAVTRTTHAGASWETLYDGDGAFCAVADGGATVYVSAQNGRIYRRSLRGDGMVDRSRVDPVGADGYLFVNPFLLDPSDNRIMYMPAGGTLWRNHDLTAIPSAQTAPVSNGWENVRHASIAGSITAVGAATSSPAHRIYYGTGEGKVYRLENADRGDPVPVEITGAGFPVGGYVNCIAVDPDDGDRAIVVFSNYNVRSLFATADGGATWSSVGGNLEQHPDGTGDGPSCRWISMLHRGTGTIYFLGTSIGLYSTTELAGKETRWHQEGATTIGDVAVDMVDVRASDGLVVAATRGAGVFSGAVRPALAGREERGRSDHRRDERHLRTSLPGRVGRGRLVDIVTSERGTHR